jgi:hypothetical protein
VISGPNFSLRLEACWRETPNDDPEHHAFRDDTRAIDLTVSAMTLAIAAEAIDEFARVLVDTRLRAEGDSARAFDRRATIYEPIVVPRPWGRAVAYYGHDESGRQFGYSGIVTRRGVISLYMSTSALGERALMEAVDEVCSRVEFDRTPLAAAGRSHAD